MRHPVRTTVLATALGAGLAFALLPATQAQAATTGLLRADQFGYAPADTKIAYLMATGKISGESYKVLSSSGATVATGTVTTTSRGSWNTAYPDVYPIDFSSVTAPGTYHVVASGAVSATSDNFKIESASAIYSTLVDDGVTFFQARRDGSNVIPASSTGNRPISTTPARTSTRSRSSPPVATVT